MKRNLHHLLSAAVMLLLMLTVFTVAAAAETKQSDYYGYSQLTEAEKTVYEVFVSTAESGSGVSTATGTFPGPIDAETFTKVFNAYRFDYPQHFWVSDTYSMLYAAGSGGYTGVTLNFDAALNTDAAKQTFAEAAARMYTASGAADASGEYEKSLLLHDTLAKYVTYDANAENGHSAYGAFVQGKAVCDGYAEAYQYLLYQADMVAHVVTGQARSTELGDWENHAWNLVRVDGKYYYTDVTWDDQGSTDEEIYYAYFNVQYKQINNKTHSFTGVGYTTQNYNNTSANYFKKNGGSIGENDWEDNGVNEIVAQLKTRDFTRLYIQNWNYANVWDWYTSNVSKIAAKLGVTGAYKCALSSCGYEYHFKLITTHTVSITGGSVKNAAVPYTCDSGATVTIVADVPAGKTFAGWTSSDVTFTDAAAAETTFVMPRCDVTITAVYRDAAPTQLDAPVGVTFAASGRDCGTLHGVDATMAYSLDGSTWMQITADPAQISGVTTAGIQLKRPGDGSTTADSAICTIAVAQAATPALTVAQPAVIGGSGTIATTSAHEYRAVGASEWTPATGPLSLVAGTYEIRVAASGNALASEAQTITITAFTGTQLPTPTATFTATGADCGILTGVTASMRYSLDGGTTWNEIAGTTFEFSGVSTTYGILVYSPGDGKTTLDSEKQRITITQAQTPNLTATQPTAIGENGTIATTNAHEYRAAGTTEWTPATGPLSLAAGTYEIRVAASGSVLASGAQSVIIIAFSGTQLPAPTATFTATGVDCGMLTGVSSEMRYSLDGGVSWNEIVGTMVEFSGVSTTYGIQVYLTGDGKTTLDSEKQIITVAQAQMPNLTVVQPTAIGESGTIATTNAHEYRTVGATEWTRADGTLSLPAGTYEIRVAASGTTLASAPQSITITAFTGTQLSMPTAIFTATGADCGILTGVTASMRYSLDGGVSWNEIAGTTVEFSGVSTTYGIQVYSPGDGKTTLDSEKQRITITQAQTPNLAVTQPTAIGENGTIATTSAHEYRVAGTAEWTSASGLLSLPSGTYEIRVAAIGTTLASEAQSITITAFTGKQLPTPTAIFTATGADCGILTGVTTSMRYSLDGGVSWNEIAGTTVEFSGGSTTYGIQVYLTGDGKTTLDSEKQIIAVTQAQTPNLTVTQPTSIGEKGTVAATSAHEYRAVGASEWTPATGPLSLAAGTYEIRVAASGSTLASEAQTITITAFTGTQLPTPTAIFIATGVDCGILTGVTPSMRYSLDGGVSWNEIAGTTVEFNGVSPEYGVQIYSPGDGKTTLDSEKQIITVTQAQTPNLTITQPTAIGENGTIATTSAHEYRAVGATEWTRADGTLSLSAGTYEIRVAASGSTLASTSQSITITAFTGKQLPIPTAIFTATGADCGILTGVTASMRYSLDGGTTWKEIAGTTVEFNGVSPVYGVQVYLLGDGKTTLASEKQRITVTQAQMPNLTVTHPTAIGENGTIATTNAHEYRAAGTAEWTPANGLLSLPAGTYEIRVAAIGTTLASEAQSITITAFTGTQLPTPTATFTANGADCGILTGVTASMRYSLDGGVSWNEIAGTTVEFNGVSPVYGVQVYHLGDGKITLDSEKQIIAVTQAQTPNLTVTQPTAIGENGTIAATSAHEYRAVGASEWTPATGPLSLPSGTYEIRVAASGSTLASAPQSITITAFTGTQLPTPTATFTATGADCGILTGVTSAMRYSLDGGTTWNEIAGTTVEFNGVSTTYGILVYSPGDGKTTLDSEKQRITITQAQTPNLTATQPTAIGENGTIATTNAHEYRAAGTTEWTPATGPLSLAAGTYEIRVAASGSVLASGAQSVIIIAFSGTQLPAPTATFTATGADCGILTGVTTSMCYSLDGGVSWNEIVGTTVEFSGVSLVYGVQVYSPGDGNTTLDSEKQIITVTQAQVPNLAVTHPTAIGENGTVAATSAHEYRAVGASEWTPANGPLSLPAGTYEIRVAASGSTLASAPQSIIITAFTGTQLPTPTATFTATGADCGILTDVTAEMRYSLDGGLTWLPISSSPMPIDAVTPVHGIRVIHPGDGAATTASTVQFIPVTQPAAPALQIAQPAAIGENGTVAATSAHEYRPVGTVAWTRAAGPLSLAAGTYEIRVAASGTTLASAAQSVTITAFTAVPAPTPSAALDSAAMQLQGLSTSMKYRVNGGAWTWATASTLDLTLLAAEPGSYLIELVMAGDGMTTCDSLPQTIAITVPAPAHRHTVTVTGSAAQVSGAGEYAAGDLVTLDAGSRAGYRFAGWTAEGITLAAPGSGIATFVMPDAEVTVTANWQREVDVVMAVLLKPMLITATATEGGSVTPGGNLLVMRNATVDIRITPDEGYRIDDVLVNGVSVGPVEHYTFTRVRDNQSIAVRFARIETP